MVRPVTLAALLALTTPALAQVAPDPAAPAPAAPAPAAPMDDAQAAKAAMARNDAPEALSRWLHVLAAHPDDVAALTGAGQSALAVGDYSAASGFLGRAEQRAPNDGTIKATIGATLARQGDARGALRYFAAASKLGVPEANIAGDRGLAYDLRGDPRRAQSEYALALQTHPGDAETIKRLALSQAIGGDQAAALATLDPLLRKQDVSAWRTRMFARAVGGDVAGATADAGLVLNAQQAATIAPYLNRLAALKPADKAAAVFLGRLPAARSTTTVASNPPREAVPLPADTPVPPAPAGPPPAAVETAPPARHLSRREALAEAKQRKKEEAAQKAEETARRNPTRYWAQIAGGANKRDLPRAWDKLKAKYAGALAGRSPATMHYRYTNRLLIGPFASSDAAQDWVNARRGEGMATFMVTTNAGTPVETLGGAPIAVAEPKSSVHSKGGKGGKSASKGKSSSKGGKSHAKASSSHSSGTKHASSSHHRHR